MNYLIKIIMITFLTPAAMLFDSSASPVIKQYDTLYADCSIKTRCLVSGKEIQFKNKSIGATSYIWKFGDNTVSTKKNPTHIFTDFGFYCITLIASNQNNSDTICETVFINPDCFNCKTKFTISDNFVISDSITVWDKNTFNNSIVTVQGDVIVPSNKTLFITGINVQFSPKGRIIVERGGTLIVNSSKLSSIVNSTMWQGIETLGDGAKSSTDKAQGKTILIKSTIANAYIGVLLGKRHLDNGFYQAYFFPFDNNFSGGIIETSNTIYKNNGTDIKFTLKKNNDKSKNRIDSCIFICDKNLPDIHYSDTIINNYPNLQNPWAGYANGCQRTDIGIFSTRMKELKITYCTFTNLNYAIFSIDNQQTYVSNCKFTNHLQGIHSENILTTMYSNYNISSCNFDDIPHNCGINNNGNEINSAVYLSGGFNDKIFDGNRFNNTMISHGVNVGIIANNCKGFNISNNIFNNLQTGIIVQNSGESGGEISAKKSDISYLNWLGNVFNNCKKAIITSGNNINLRIRLNDIHGMFSDEFLINNGVLGDQGFDGFDKEKSIEKKSIHAAGNFFVYNISNKISSITPFNYYYQPISGYVPNVKKSQLVNLISVNAPPIVKAKTCLFPDFTNINLPISLNDPVFKRIDSLNNVMLALESQYLTLISNADKGHTLELLNEINTVPPTGQLKNMLIENSPLSDTVLTALNIQNPLSNGNYKNVMEENLPVTRNVVPAFNSRIETMPPGIKNQLKDKQAYNPGKITSGYLETMLGQAKLTKQLYFNEIISLLTDTVNNRTADAITLFEREGTPVANMILAATYLSDSNYSSAAAKIALLPDDGSQYSLWKAYSTFLLNHYAQGKTLEELDSNQIEYIRMFAYRCPEEMATVNAKAILMYLFREEVPACPENGTRSMRFENNKIKQAKKSYLGENYPDPFTRNTIIPYYLPEGAKGELIIKDVTGRIILTLSLHEGENTLEIDSKDWANGIYFYGMKINDENIENKKMIKTE